MDYDVNNRPVLDAGAYYRSHSEVGGGWRPMSEAPRDGTVIEVRCTYGVAPWYGLFRWTDGTETIVLNGEKSTVSMPPRWAKMGDDRSGFSEDSSFSWRPYNGAATSYTDPTGGMQNSPAYWRGASAAKYGLPVDSFEKDVVSEKKPWRGFWSWLFD